MLIPVAAVRPYLQKWVAQGRSLRELARQSGIPPRTLEAVARLERAGCRFAVADRLLAALGAPEAWHTDPELRRYYEGAG